MSVRGNTRYGGRTGEMMGRKWLTSANQQRAGMSIRRVYKHFVGVLVGDRDGTQIQHFFAFFCSLSFLNSKKNTEQKDTIEKLL